MYNGLNNKLFAEFLAANRKENFVYSPLSVITLLCMVLQAASGETRKEIIEAVARGDDYNEIEKQWKKPLTGFPKTRR